ncbi:MFS transporter [bacterium]|nr:MFS transporter [bacterium]
MGNRYYTDESKKMYYFLLMMTILNSAGLQVWQTLLNNFAVEVVHINGFQIGIIQGLREVPGFLALLVIYLLLIFKEHRLDALSIGIVGIGLWLTGFMPSYYGLLFTCFVTSIGVHLAMTLNDSLTLQYFDKTKTPLVMTKIRSVTAAANVGVGLFILGASFIMNYSQIYFISGTVITATALLYTFKDPTNKDIPVQKKKMILKLRYWLFYTLTFMSGARRQIYLTFAIFLLVEKFKFSLTEITTLFLVNNALNYFINPMIGWAINRFGERKVLFTENITSALVFLVYAYTDSKMLVAATYIVDYIAFNFTVAIKTHFQKIADPKDIAGSMTMGVTMNHIIAVMIPIIGGAVWMIDKKIPFFIGAALSFITLFFTRFVRVEN